MNLQPQQKASNKRTGKRITFFNEPQSLTVPGKVPQLKEQQFYESSVKPSIPQASDFSKVDGFTSASSSNMLNTVMFTQERPDAMRGNQQQVSGKWNVPDRHDTTWQTQAAAGWPRNPTGYGVNVVSSYYNQQESQKRSQDKAVGVSQVDIYGDALQQMMSQKAQLGQQTLARQQAHLNSVLQAQQQQQLQQQQKQQQTLSLQSFQMAFGHQGHKQAFSELFHVFPDASSNVSFAPQQKQQTALPQMQLFENFYPTQQQQQAVFGIQPAASMAQPQGVSQQKIQVISQSQHAPASEDYMKALAEQNQKTVPPKAQIPLPRRSRRLSKEGLQPLPPSEINQPYKVAEGQVTNPYLQNPYEHVIHQQVEGQERYKRGYSQIHRDTQVVTQDRIYGNRPLIDNVALHQNGRVVETQTVGEQSGLEKNDFGGAGTVTGGVIHTTRRRRRISQEANLFTLAQKASELLSLQNTKQEADVSGNKKNEEMKANMERVEIPVKRVRGECDLRPLVMPVSVPVKMEPGKEKGEHARTQKSTASVRESSGSMPSVIVTQNRAGLTINSEASSLTNDASPSSEGDTQSRKPKQRPRPEPLFIPPKPGTFIVPVVYSNITPYQSHLRSPVRVPDHTCDRNFELPPYTPPPILSPVREGSGLYFNTIMSASSHGMPPPITPKSSTRTLLRSNSTEDMPPLLTAVGEATPVNIEPRINIGSRFQAEIPDLRDQNVAIFDEHKADIVWKPLETSTCSQEEAVEKLLNAACSSILPGGGTNQELALHYLHETKGNILAALDKLLFRKPQRNRNHPLCSYHYSGSDRWSIDEKRLFNKGMAIYKKDFLLVQKLIKTKTVSQCVEFYYTYKKQVKIGRNGIIIFGDVEFAIDEKNPREDSEIDFKSSHQVPPVLPPRREGVRLETSEGLARNKNTEELKIHVKTEEFVQENDEVFHSVKITQTLEACETGNDTLILRNQESDCKVTENAGKSKGRRPRKKFPPDDIKSGVNKKPPEQEGHFPCKKCGRVFLKVKSRSAHMKSHAEQEKKAAALKQKEVEAAQAALHARMRYEESSESDSSSSDSSSQSCDTSDDGEI